jgi:hypothetical protein
MSKNLFEYNTCASVKHSLVALLLARLLAEGTKDLVEGLEGTLGPDDEAADVTTGGQLKQVQSANRGKLHTGDVAEGLGDARVLGVHHQGTAADNMTAVAHLANARADLAALLRIQ